MGLLLAALLGASAAQAQNILILTTGARNDNGDTENSHMPYTVEEFSSPLTFTSFASGGSACNSTQSTTGANGVTKSVTCNQTELVNGTPMSPSIFDPGYDVLVIASAYTTIDAADWPVIEDAVKTRKVRGAVFFVDTINNANTVAMEGVLGRAMGATVTRGSQSGSGRFYFPLNTNAAAAASFTVLPRLELHTGFYAYNGIPPQFNLYTGLSGPANGPTVALTLSPPEAAPSTAMFVPQSDSFGGTGACVFGVSDIGWGKEGSGHNIGKLGVAFLDAFNKSAADGGVCAAALAAPPEIAITKTTTANTAVFPANGTTVPYSVDVTNTSSGALALNVGVSDPPPAGITLGQWTCTQVPPTPPTVQCPTGLTAGALNTTIPSLPAGATLRFTSTGTVTDNSLALTNVATANLPPGATCAGGATPCASQVAFGAPPSVSLVCTPTSLNDSAGPPATCTVTASSAAPAGGLTVALAPLAANPRYTTTCGTSIIVPAGATTSAPCTITATPNTVVGDGNVVANLALAAPPAGATYVLGTPASAQVTVRDDDLAPVPTLGFWGLVLLALGLGGVAWRRQHGLG
ncbi:IPTL-CTERM sorting domain-containing protein [Ottowia flava]|uniref:IPTL-CTERM sorting domain-containing protein n=2 Tax=Ottowia flava TaxID=2675430 RepID=A0ABW4KYJ8_9BURK|nr:IPTL-CTERM sorting domain-containing protein [Ottowia sp. GY511]